MYVHIYTYIQACIHTTLQYIRQLNVPCHLYSPYQTGLAQLWHRRWAARADWRVGIRWLLDKEWTAEPSESDLLCGDPTSQLDEDEGLALTWPHQNYFLHTFLHIINWFCKLCFQSYAKQQLCITVHIGKHYIHIPNTCTDRYIQIVALLSRS